MLSSAINKTISAVLVFSLILGLPVLAIAVSHSATTNSVTTDLSVTSQTTSLTIASCTNCVVFACVTNEGNSGLKPTGIVFNTSENFSEVVTATITAGGAETVATIFRLLNPTVTTADVVVSFSATGNNDRSLGSSFLLYQDVDQTTPVEASNTANGTGTTLSVSVTTLTANALVVDCAAGDHNGGLTVGGSQTMRVDRTLSNQQGQGVSELLVASPGAQAMSWTQTTEEWSHVSAALKNFVTSTNGVKNLMLGVK